MNYFICKECETKYQSTQESPPPGIRWDDGHICKPVKIKTEKNGKNNSNSRTIRQGKIN